MLWIGVVILCLLVTKTTGECCPENWIREGGSCYLFIPNKESWFEANTVCGLHGAALVAIESPEEDAFVKGFINGLAGLGASVQTWLGGTDMEAEGVWKWVPSGEPFRYTAWFPGQPNIPSGGDCLMLYPHDKTGYTWGDGDCGRFQLTFMCEKKLSTGLVG